MSIRDERAFPMSYEPGRDYSDQQGLTVRQYFAIHILQGLISSDETTRAVTQATSNGMEMINMLTNLSVEATDALIKRLEEK